MTENEGERESIKRGPDGSSALGRVAVFSQKIAQAEANGAKTTVTSPIPNSSPKNMPGALSKSKATQ